MMKSTPPLAIRSWRRFVAIAGLLIVALVAMIGCSSDSNDEPTKAAEPTTRVIDTEKGSVTVPASAERIVVLSGGLAGYLYALDAPVVATDTRVLGVTNLDGGFPPAWSDAAKAQGTKELPAGEQLNIEAVAAAEPDLIIGGGQGITSVQAEELYDQLTAIAPTVLVPKTVANWDKQLEIVADAAGRSDKVPALISAYDDKVKEVKGKIKVPEATSSTFSRSPTTSRTSCRRRQRSPQCSPSSVSRPTTSWPRPATRSSSARVTRSRSARNCSRRSPMLLSPL
ncbi:hypothetical protein N806_18220 [Rhodococcus sp. P27]|nr:hypothetical protein N806_18220 [Rhodococcus sp. P27]